MQAYKKYLAALLAVGILFRIYSALNTPVINTDEILYMVIAAGTSTSTWARLSTLLHGPLYFYLTDFAFNFLGHASFSARLVSVVFGGASIVLVYLLGAELYEKKTALVAAALFAVSAAASTLGVLALFDPLVSTFLLLAAFLLLRHMRSGSRKELAGSLAALALAINTKVIALYFVPALAVLFIASKARVEPRKAAVPLLLFLLLLLPIPAYNYFMYSSKGLLDLHFTSVLGLGQPEEWLAQKTLVGQRKWDVGESLRENLAEVPAAVFGFYSIPFLLLAVVGIAAAVSARGRAGIFMLAWVFAYLLFFLLYIFHSYYILYLAPAFALLAAAGMMELLKRIGEKNRRIAFAGMLLLVAVGELAAAAGVMHGKDATYQLQERIQVLPENSIVLLDDAIWKGEKAWIGVSGRQDVMSLSEFYDLQKSLEGTAARTPYDVYYVRCVLGDCGAKEMENASVKASEAMNSQLSQQGQPALEIYEGKEKRYAVYELSVEGYLFGRKGRIFMNYDIGHPERSVDVYETHGPVEAGLDAIAHASLWVNLLLALAAPLFAFSFLVRAGSGEYFE